MAHKLEALHLKAVCEAVRGPGAEAVGAWAQGQHRARVLVTSGPVSSWQDIKTWMKDKSEVEVVDLVLKLREKLVRQLPALPGWGLPDGEGPCP